MKNSPVIDNERSQFYTGQKSKNLLVHIMQDGLEVDKPIKTKIYAQKVEWKKRQYPIVPERFYYDYEGTAHQMVASNDASVLTYHKDHTDTCKKCGGRMTIDARQARELGKRGVFNAIWGIDSTHLILLIIFALGAMGAVGFAVYEMTEDTKHKAQLDSATKQISDYKAQLGIVETPSPTEGGTSGTVTRSNGSVTRGK